SVPALPACPATPGLPLPDHTPAGDAPARAALGSGYGKIGERDSRGPLADSALPLPAHSTRKRSPPGHRGPLAHNRSPALLPSASWTPGERALVARLRESGPRA